MTAKEAYETAENVYDEKRLESINKKIEERSKLGFMSVKITGRKMKNPEARELRRNKFDVSYDGFTDMWTIRWD